MRDYFAAKAMQSLVQVGVMHPKIIARSAYMVADAMLEARK